MQSAAKSSTPTRSHVRRVRILTSATFLMVGLAVGNWPASVHAQSYSSTETVR